ncbi:hypothetical protein EXN66_Car014136 [Channa argus]|uniref:Ig-like domain-containing protein n=1 Tax=Channa argus TaxID=215402 RepID=A0A6G1Q7C7_CHAAH|nr:hypothetical protein EXN66_Car014136 [Channa argus]
MKTTSVSLLLGVSVLLLMSGLTVSAVSLNVSANLQQFFTRGPPVSLSCVEDGQTVDGWTVKTTRGGQIEECGAAGSDFGRLDGSSCVLDVSTKFSTDHWCESSSGQRSDQVTITVTDKDLILEIPALPVLTGSNVTLSCRNRNGDKVKAYFYKNGKVTEDKLQRVQQSDEGLYSCFTDEDGKSPQSRLRVRDPPPTSDPHITTASTTTTVYAATSFNVNNNNTDASASFSFTVPLVAALGSLVLLILVVAGLVQLCRKQTEMKDSSSPVDVTYADVNIRQPAIKREQPPDPDVLYSSVRAGIRR